MKDFLYLLYEGLKKMVFLLHLRTVELSISFSFHFHFFVQGTVNNLKETDLQNLKFSYNTNF